MQINQIKNILINIICIVCIINFSFAKDNIKKIVYSITPTFDIPIYPDNNLFSPSGGFSLKCSKQISESIFSVGVKSDYHLGIIQNDDLGKVGSLSIMSFEPLLDLKWNITNVTNMHFVSSAGFFHSLLHKNTSMSVSNVVFSGNIGIGFRKNPKRIVGIEFYYKRYNRLMHLLGLGVSFDLIRFKTIK